MYFITLLYPNAVPQARKVASTTSNVLTAQPWYHAAADRKKAEALLKQYQKVCTCTVYEINSSCMVDVEVNNA